MDYIPELLGQLRQKLLAVDCSAQGRMRITLPLPLEQNDSILRWLDAQALFPAFYWCNRDNSEEAALVGAAIKFNDLASANDFISQAPQTDMRVWGLNAFDQLSEPSLNKAKGFLFLPRLEIRHSKHNGAMISVNLYSETSLKEDALNAVKALDVIALTATPSRQKVAIVSAIDLPGQQQWQALLEKALSAIESKTFDKVVLARKTTLTLEQTLNPVRFIERSKEANSRCFHFMMRFNEEQAFLGSSPELLFFRKGNKLTTEALAGTVASSTDDDEAQRLAGWLMNDNKNRHENQLVVDDICQRLKPFVKKVAVGPIEIVKLRKVQHLRRGIQAELNYINDVDCLYWLQPTAAVAGLPRQPALDFILKNEPFDREWYAGSAGYISEKQTEFSVSLRSALIQNNKICLYAGAGIVAGSDPLYEWLEIDNKAAGLRTLLKES